MAIHVGFSTTNRPLSRLIRWVTGAPCSHVFLLMDSVAGPLVMEADSVWRVVSWTQFKRKNRVVALILPPKDLTPGIHIGAELLGSKYDLFGMVWLGIAVLLLKRRFRNPRRSIHAVFCSEGVARIMLAAGYTGIPDPELVTPGDLLNYFAER